MKLTELKNKLEEKQLSLDINKRRVSSVKKVLRTNNKENIITSKDETKYNKLDSLSSLNESNVINQESTLDNVKVIGITGSKGKSSVSYIVHEYLKLKGRKSILYSSVLVDSPVSIKRKAPMEVALYNESSILDVLEEAESYEADYVVLEVNETAIEKGLVKDVNFAVRALTNIIPDCNKEHYDELNYVKLKESFFKDVDNSDNCKCVIGLTGYFDRLKFNDFLKLNNFEAITYASKKVCENNNADYTNIDLLYYNNVDNINRTSFNLRIKDKIYTFNSKLLLPHSIDNIVCSASIIEALGEFDEEVFRKLLLNITIPGREEVIKANGRTIIIGVFLSPVLTHLKRYKERGECDCIKVVCGMIGVGFKTWEEYLNSERRIKLIDFIHRDAMSCVKKNSDYIYITSNDPAASNKMQICLNLARHINNEIPSCIIEDRKRAIKQAIYESNPKDVIYIAGRGNRKLYCESKDSMDVFSDKDIVLNTLKELGW